MVKNQIHNSLIISMGTQKTRGFIKDMGNSKIKVKSTVNPPKITLNEWFKYIHKEVFNVEGYKSVPLVNSKPKKN